MTNSIRPGRFDADSPYASDGISGRHSAMVNAMGTLRPVRNGRFPMEAALITAGSFCVPLGLIAIIAGWYGVAHTGYVFEQNSYLISGGILGLGLIFIGCFLYFAYWMTRQLRATEMGHQQTLRALSRMERQLSAVSAAIEPSRSLANGGTADVAQTGRRRNLERPPPAAFPIRRDRANPNAVPVPELVATERGSLLHRPDCQIVANKHNLRVVDPDSSGYRPCQVCHPFDED